MIYKLAQVVKEYKGKRVLDIDQLELVAGNIYCLEGSNGAGKSTLLNLLAFLEQPTSGEISFAGERVRANNKSGAAVRKRVVLVDQSPILFSGPVWKNVEFGLKVRKVDKKERQKRIEEALQLVGMKDFYFSDAQKLSGGETKRVALARAFVVKPDVLLLDEPSANVDVKNQKILLDIIHQINKQHHTTIIFSTHIPKESRLLADKTFFLQQGKLAPLSEDNCFQVTVVSCDMTKAVCEIENTNIQIEAPISGRCSSGDSFRLEIDRERVQFPSNDTRIPEENVFSGEVVTLAVRKDKYLHKINMGIELSGLLSEDDYLKNPVILGQSVLVHIPLQAVTLRPSM